MKKLFRKMLGLPFSMRQARLAQTRPPITKEEFVKRIVRSGGDSVAAPLIFDKLVEFIYSEELTPYPDDHLEFVYGIAEEELDEDLILDILDRLSLAPPSPDQLAAFGPVETPQRVAHLVSLARKSHKIADS